MLLESRTPSEVIFNVFFKNDNINIGLSFEEKYVAGVKDAKQSHFSIIFSSKINNINVGCLEKKYVAGIDDAKQNFLNNFFFKNNINIGLSFAEKYVAGIEDAKQCLFQQFFLQKQQHCERKREFLHT